MKYLALLSFLVLFSCGKTTDKNTQLAELKEQQKTLQTKIETLEKELRQAKEPNNQRKAIPIQTITLETTNFKHFVEVQGNVQALNVVLVSPQTGGMLTSILVKEGDKVQKGQLIATLDNQIMQESIAEVTHQLELARILFEKQKKLWEQQVGTEVQFLTAKSNKESLEKRLATMQAQLALSKVYSPITGTVEIVRQKQGEMAAPGVPIAQIVNLNALKIVAKVADTYLASIKKGDAMVVKFVDIDKSLRTKINVINTLVDPLSRTFGIESNIPNVGGLLKPNQLAVVTINDLTKKNALVIPQNLVQKTELGDVVYITEGQGDAMVAKGKIVKTGIAYNGQVEIIEGLQKRNKVVSAGYQELVDGVKVISQ